MGKIKVCYIHDVVAAVGARPAEATVGERCGIMAGFGIPENQDFVAMRETALAAIRARAPENNEGLAARPVAAPDEKREVTKSKLREKVADYLAKRPKVHRLRERFYNLSLAKP